MAIIIYAIGPFTRNFREFLMILQKFVLRNEEIFPFAKIYPPQIFKPAMRENLSSKKVLIFLYFVLFYLVLLVVFFTILILFFFSLDNWPFNVEFNWTED